MIIFACAHNDTLPGAGIFASLDIMTVLELCEHVAPSLHRAFMLAASERPSQDSGSITASRHIDLLNILLKLICSSGRPVLLAIDNLHSATPLVVDMLTKLINDSSRICKQGMLVVGAYEREQHDMIMSQIENVSNLPVTYLCIRELGRGDISKLLSYHLCLPVRYTDGLAEIVYRKTMGCPGHVVKFLEFIHQAKLFSFDVESRRWIWDVTLIESQRIDEGVASLLIRALDQLPKSLTKTLQIVSCVGSQIAASTLTALNSGDVLPYDMQQEIRLAVKEGLLDEVGNSRYSFSHSAIKEALYNRIPENNRKLLHRTIGKNLLKVAGNDPTIHFLGTDQVNMYCKDEEALSSEECSEYVNVNMQAANYAMAAGSLEQGECQVCVSSRLKWSKHFTDWLIRLLHSPTLHRLGYGVGQQKQTRGWGGRKEGRHVSYKQSAG